jgi:hypothetical protein
LTPKYRDVKTLRDMLTYKQVSCISTGAWLIYFIFTMQPVMISSLYFWFKIVATVDCNPYSLDELG